MKTALLLLATAASALAQSGGMLPNPSFEITIEARPKGFRIFPSPSTVEGEFFVADGKEGDTTKTGISAIQFHFPAGAELSQAVWTGDPQFGGTAVEPGRYTCSFWIKAEDLLEGFHTWVSITGYAANGSRIGEIARSDYLRSHDLPFGEWTRISFSFAIAPEDEVARIAPSVIFKTHPSASINAVPPTTRIIVDDLDLVKK